MGSMICMNELCRATTSSEWKKGWGFKSGGFAKLCYNCGSAFENLIFCETFHPDESGWRECRTCRKHIHCGCVASKYLYEYLDYGGVACINCARHLDSHSIRPIQDPINSKDGYRSLHWCGKTLKVEPRKCRSHIQKYKPKSRDSQIPGVDHPNGTLGSKSAQPLGVDNKMDENDFDRRRLMQTNEPGQLFQTQRNDKKQETMLPIGNVGTCFSNLNQQNIGASLFGKPDNERPSQGVKDMYESINQPSLNFCLSTPIGTSSSGQPFLGGDVEGKEQSKASPFQQGQRERHILPKPPKPSPTSGSESKRMVSHARIARPPAEGRGGRNQLLPRYWPRITDQELQQLSGDLKSTIVPLFEKVLSASDAGRIGRLVLPKACAEAYFPPINQSEGLPIRIQDIKGKEWTFQFRFWPNNNSRMYVLEGVTPCIQNMQLQAGDTVIFSRIDPGGKLVMGFRKATNNVDMQDSQMPLLPNGNGSGETSFSGMADNFLNGGRTSDDTVNRQVPMSEKKKARNIGSKNKRLLMHADDAMELRITWEEIQELLRPSPMAKPNIVMVEDCEFEEYEEAPVFGKRTIFTARSSGDQEQWAQCDSCSKWRRLPLQVLLPAKWTCLDNIWDSRRCSCAAPDEISPRELEALFRVGKDPKRRKLVDNNEDNEPYGLDALATMAALGDNIGEEPSVGATTKHPRHRPGCSCIVCIQPPSGKGKHPSTCKCNVCLTMKRRFKTLMLRKKKKQAELAQAKDQVLPRDESETDGMTSGIELLQMNHSENEHMNHSDNERNSNGDQVEEFAPGKGQLDLNCDPNRDDDMLAEATAGMSMTSLVNAANLPLEYLTQNRLENLGNSLLSQAAGESEGHHPDNGFVKTADVELESKGDKA